MSIVPPYNNIYGDKLVGVIHFLNMLSIYKFT
jgi:hypothetical protein